MDSPQHVIRPINTERAPPAVAAVPKGRTAKSDEDGQLMYVVIKPAAAKPRYAKKYKADNQAIYMSGNDDRRMPRLNLASGAYPVFYSIAAANGKFGRNIRALTKEEISRAGKSYKGKKALHQ